LSLTDPVGVIQPGDSRKVKQDERELERPPTSVLWDVDPGQVEIGFVATPFG
jgi:hypothetical protein